MTNHLEHFVKAQDGIFDEAIKEIEAGKKQSHWMWFVFPQLRGLGRSTTAFLYGIRTLDEAREYLAHPILGPRLEQATQCVLEAGVPPQNIFGEIDGQKFASCMTLFGAASSPKSLFNSALRTITTIDKKTIQMLGEAE